ncbi:hypothetical protein CLOP_g12883 [Closterium sp. NIES-67]|nr:hypothetical protein CLOP_g12883 [Closterium sp. NIES-67]
MRNASKGLVLFFVGAGWNTPRRWERAVRVPKSSDVFIRVAAPMVVDLGILGVMLHEIPMMPISFYSSPPGVSSQRLIEEELPAFTLAMAFHDPTTPEWPIFLPMAKSSVTRGWMPCS